MLQARQSFFTPYTILGLAVDYFLNVGAILLATTLYSNQPALLGFLLAAPLVIIYILPPERGSSRPKKPKVASSVRPEGSSRKPNALPVKPFLTTYRGCMLVITCVAILAVDFRLFPRRFAKVETWGTSLMDMGVGSFVFASGLVAARPALQQKTSGRLVPLSSRLFYAARHSLPLLVLGLVRLGSVKGLDYAEHVTEYGIHWNFFFTLGFLPPFVAVSQAALSLVPSNAAWALLIAAIYQYLLENTGLKAFVLAAPRTSLISMNREGICSFFGYLAIFLAGEDLGMLIIPRQSSRGAKTGSVSAQKDRFPIAMVSWAVSWAGLYWLSTSYSYGLGLTVSRRLANLPYVLWVAAFNSIQILIFHIIDWLVFPAFYRASDAVSEKEAHDRATSRILRAYNRNGLAIFLVANLLTGLVNMTTRTLEASPMMTMGVLLAYTAMLTGTALALDAYDVSVKL